MPLAVALYSALANYCGDADVIVYVLDGGVSKANRSRIDAIAGSTAATVHWITPHLNALRQVAVTDRYPMSVYLRLLIPSLLPLSVEKAIYLDSDIIVDHDLSELWKCDLDSKAVLAVQDDGVLTVGSPLGLMNWRELGFDPSRKYFNSGVLVLNLRRWREQELALRIIEYIAEHPGLMRFGEQDAMNVILSNDWGELDRKWNQLVAPGLGPDGREFRCGILHFVSKQKPWIPEGAHRTNCIYDRYTRRSGWYSTVGWLKYYCPLMVRRQHVLRVRAHLAHA
jgi:lipopolysaccharide biosynthesis glycosyltransferase